ncbi:MAG: hypothetical protein K8T10_01425 [Candidatus Eremiobacteraeota bacterium]|nr:hypothetical protein [Candidatus Eremiobacteraeota bacterium]
MSGKHSNITIFSNIILALLFLFSNASAQETVEKIYVTGKPASSSHLRRTIVEYFKKQGKTAQIPDNSNLKTLFPGQNQKIIVTLLKDEEKESQEEKQTVKVINENVPIVPCEFLAFSNHPEKITKRGLLYQAGLIRHKPVRLRYYHLGDKNAEPHYVGFYLVNNTSKPARTHIVESLGGPSKNYMLAGHMNNLKFFSYKGRNIGFIEEIPPHSVKMIRRVLLKPGEVVSSTADLHLLQGGPLQIVMYASDKKDSDLAVELLTSKTDRHARGAYPLTKIVTRGVFSTQDGESIYTIADTPLEDIFKGRKIRGNYGVMYEFDLTLKNPYPEERKVSFYFQPRGGIATATFSFDNRPVSVGFTPAYKMVKLCSIKVPAGGKKKVIVKTMPEDASNYPVRLIIMNK